MKYSNAEKRKIVKDDYDAIAEVFATSYSEIDLYKPYIDEFVKSLNGKKILDVGCGAGQFTNYFCELGFNAKGIDFSSALLSIARGNYPKIEFVNADICEYKTTDLYDLPPALMNEDIRIVCLDKSSKTKRIYLEQPIPAPFCLTMLQCEATYRSMP